MNRLLVLATLLFSTFPAFAQVPLTNFHQVNTGIYRSARPDEADIAALRAMGVRTILNLEDDEVAVANEIAIAKRYGIRVISTPMSGFWKPRDAQVDLSLHILNDARNYPILVHCQHGEDRTGLIVGLFRVFTQKWNPAQAYAEMKELGFHPVLIFLRDYFMDATGLDD